MKLVDLPIWADCPFAEAVPSDMEIRALPPGSRDLPESMKGAGVLAIFHPASERAVLMSYPSEEVLALWVSDQLGFISRFLGPATEFARENLNEAA